MKTAPGVVAEVKNKLLSGRRRHQFEFSERVNSMFANSENKGRLDSDFL